MVQMPGYVNRFSSGLSLGQNICLSCLLHCPRGAVALGKDRLSNLDEVRASVILLHLYLSTKFDEMNVYLG